MTINILESGKEKAMMEIMLLNSNTNTLIACPPQKLVLPRGINKRDIIDMSIGSSSSSCDAGFIPMCSWIKYRCL